MHSVSSEYFKVVTSYKTSNKKIMFVKLTVSYNQASNKLNHSCNLGDCVIIWLYTPTMLCFCLKNNQPTYILHNSYDI